MRSSSACSTLSRSACSVFGSRRRQQKRGRQVLWSSLPLRLDLGSFCRPYRLPPVRLSRGWVQFHEPGQSVSRIFRIDIPSLLPVQVLRRRYEQRRPTLSPVHVGPGDSQPEKQSAARLRNLLPPTQQPCVRAELRRGKKQARKRFRPRPFVV